MSPSTRLRLSRRALILAALAVPCAARAGAGHELVMVERPGCPYCAQWNAQVAPTYPRTPEGRFAPLRRIQLHNPVPADLTLSGRVVFTPTFVLVRDGLELGRIEGYPGEDFFWGLLGMLLKSRTDYVPSGAWEMQRRPDRVRQEV